MVDYRLENDHTLKQQATSKRKWTPHKFTDPLTEIRLGFGISVIVIYLIFVI
jgi:hypothetical protein